MNTEHEQVAWFKSSYSGSGGGDCVEVAMPPAAVHVRDSKVPQGPALTFAATEWTTFVRHVRELTLHAPESGLAMASLLS